MIGVGGPVLGWILVGIAALLIAGGLVPRALSGIQFWAGKARKIRLRWPFYVPPTEVELARRRENQRFGQATIEQRSPETSREMAQLREQVERLTAERDALKEQNERLGGRPENEDLKRRSRELADEIRQFLEDSESEGLDKEEIMKLYRRSLGDKASALLEELEEHNLYPPKNLQSFEIAANANPLSPFAIGNLAKTLGTTGHRTQG
jgi:hypothetical protein